MADDKAQFGAATRRWEQLRTDESFSRPALEGTVAILASYYTDPGREFEREEFRDEALALADRLRMIGRNVTVGLDARFNDINQVIRDPDISDVHLIGHGTLSSISVRPTLISSNSYYTWFNASLDANHLKQGVFAQRMCGVIKRGFSPPLGLFVVRRHDQVLAAVGEQFSPKGIDDPVNDRLRPLILGRQMTYEYVKNSFIMQPPSETEPTPIVIVPPYAAV